MAECQIAAYMCTIESFVVSHDATTCGQEKCMNYTYSFDPNKLAEHPELAPAGSALKQHLMGGTPELCDGASVTGMKAFDDELEHAHEVALLVGQENADQFISKVYCKGGNTDHNSGAIKMNKMIEAAR